MALHANMQQRQRLKNLSRFVEREHAVLLATDVAARGLDIKGIQHVLHYQMPRDPETYVHRSGRTARALEEGLAIALLAPDDMFNYRKVIKAFNGDEDLATFPVESRVLPTINRRITAAQNVDDVERKSRKTSSHNSWFAKQAADMDIVLDDGLLKDEGDDEDEMERKSKLKSLRGKLKALLAKPLDEGPGSGKGRLQVARGKGHRQTHFGAKAGAAINMMKDKKLKKSVKGGM